jgi:hypothetical protein
MRGREVRVVTLTPVTARQGDHATNPLRVLDTRAVGAGKLGMRAPVRAGGAYMCGRAHAQ